MADIVDLVSKLKTNIPQELKVCMPAMIETYDFKTQKASVKITMQELYEDGSTVDYPIITGVPVVFMAAGGASINLPVLKGDNCFVIFFDRDMSNWLLGGVGQKPDSTRMHHTSDAVAIMGLSPFTNISKAENNTDVLINYSGSKITIKPDGILNIETTKDINIKAIEDITVNCKNATVTADELITVNSKNTNITTTEDITVNCKNITATASETATLSSKNIVIQNSELVTLNSKNITIENSEVITVNSKDLTITATENVNVNSKTATLTTTENVNVNCVDAIIIASNEIKTTSIKFIQTGDMSISGKLDVGDGITNKGDINNDGDIKNFGNIVNNGGQVSSGSVVLDTHTHSYEAPVVGSNPTAAVPAFTGTPV